MKILCSKYQEWNIYYPENDKITLELGKNIIDSNYSVIKILKEGKRNYVAIISTNGKKYILKEFRSEIIIPQRKIQTYFKRGEALTTLKNGLESIEEDVFELVRPIAAIVKRKKTIEKSYLIMEYVLGQKLQTTKDIDEVIRITKKIHKLKRYHGDLNTSNFIKTSNGLKVLDTQMKKGMFFSFKKYYDILTLKEDLLVINLKYNVEENYKINKFRLSFVLAFLIKRLKKLKIINIMRKYKKDLREKGWKI
ncbi:lipopolysaccharide core heptose(II) kinase RfaY [Fusobacterium sp. SB021]|uniref:lipopolysaccharide core heptose(II) kinase RfaY n=1 Tax=Fusobacterium sp. SB021 TaxID=2744227 RepID=UPI003CF1A959